MSVRSASWRSLRQGGWLSGSKRACRLCGRSRTRSRATRMIWRASRISGPVHASERGTRASNVSLIHGEQTLNQHLQLIARQRRDPPPSLHRGFPAALRSLRQGRRGGCARRCAAFAASEGESQRREGQRRRVLVNRAQCPHQKAASCHDGLHGTPDSAVRLRVLHPASTGGV
jgi:hypothetical protein